MVGLDLNADNTWATKWRMRKIKFRAWDKEINKITKDSRSLTDIIEDDGYRADGMVFMQYTGLKDKNGKEIYEGDILGYEDKTTAPVAWNDKLLNWELKDKLMLWAIRDDMEVIGNIYENKDLIK